MPAGQISSRWLLIWPPFTKKKGKGSFQSRPRIIPESTLRAQPGHAQSSRLQIR